MNLDNPFRAEISGLPGGSWVNEAFDHLMARVNQVWKDQHQGDGSHGQITLTLGDPVPTAFLVGEGVWIAPTNLRGMSGVDGAYDFRIGDPDGNYIAWDGSTSVLSIVGGITATVGNIGGWVIGETYIRSEDEFVGFSTDPGSNIRIWAGSPTIASAPFRVEDDGSVFASDATITGASGTVTIDGDGILVDPSHNGGGFVTESSYRFGADWGMFGDFSDGGPTYTTEILTTRATNAIVDTALRSVSNSHEAVLTVEADDFGARSAIFLDADYIELDGTPTVTGSLTVNNDISFGAFLSSGTVADANDHVQIQKGMVRIGNAATSSQTAASFRNANGTVGSITTSGSATAFNTTSDGELKRDRGRSKQHGSRLAALVIHDYEMKADGAIGVGVFAQEAYAHAPFAITPGDAEQGIPWMVDYSKFVPDLIAETQDLRARLNALEARA